MRLNAFAERLRAALEERLRDRWGTTYYPEEGVERREWDLPGLHVRDVVTEMREDDFDLRVIFSEDRRPGCVFGYVWRNLWSLAEQEERQVRGPDPSDDEVVTEETVSGYATLMYATLDEQVSAGDLGLPDCRPGELTWIEEREPRQP